MNEPLEAAREYTKRGWKVLPVAPGQKGTHVEKWQELNLSEKDLPDYFQPDSNVGILLGAVSGHLTDIDLDCPEAINAGHKFLPNPTLISGRGRNMSHLWYVCDGAQNVKFKDTDGTILLEIRSDKHQTVVEPSTHPSGDKYRWFNSESPMKISWPDLKKAANYTATATLISRHLPGTGRHDLALAFAGFLLKHISGDDVYSILKIAWEQRNPSSDAFNDLYSAIQNTQEKIENGEPHTGRNTLDQMLPGVSQAISRWFGWTISSGSAVDRTDYGNGQLLAERYGTEIKFVHEWKKWAYFTGKRWMKDEIGHVKSLASETIKHVFLEASMSPNDEAKSMAKWALQSLNNGKIESMLNMAKTIDGMTVSAEDFDRDLYLLNCENGTLDLRTGKLREHRREDMITRIVPLKYDPGAQAPRFEQFLHEILPNEETRTFVHRAIGYSLTGDVSERVLFIAQGPGNNGKSTLLNACADVLGDYAARANSEVFLDKPAGHIPNDVADLKGPRLVLASEVERNRRLSEAQVKNFTGGSDKLKARFLFGEYFEFYPRFTAWILTNPLPRINGTDAAIWNRLRVIPFHTIPPNLNPHLPNVLKKEYEGILAWMVRGFHDYEQNGLPVPQEVHQIRSKYRMDSDAVARFVDEECSLGPTLQEALDKLFSEYRDWATENEEFIINKNRFGQRLDDLGFGTATHNRKVHRTGLCYGKDEGGGDPHSPEPGFDPLATLPIVAQEATVNEVDSNSVGQQDSVLDVRRSGREKSEGNIDGLKFDARKRTVSDNTPHVDGQDSPDTSDVATKRADGKDVERNEESAQVDEVADRRGIPATERGHMGEVRALADQRQTGEDEWMPPRVGGESGALDVWAIDTETTGLSPRSGDLRLLTYFNPAKLAKPAYFDLETEHREARDFLRSIGGSHIVAHNAAFDLAFLDELLPGFSTSVKVLDTMILSQIVYAGRDVPPLKGFNTSHSLEACLERELGQSISKGLQGSDWSGELSVEQKQYALEDVRHLPRLLDTLRDKNETASEIVELEMGLIPVIVDMERRGVYVDAEAWKVKANEVQQHIHYIEHQLDRFGRVATSRLYPIVDGSGEFVPDSEFNWSSPADVVLVARVLGIPLEDSRDATLAGWTQHRFIRVIRQHRKYSKLLKSYGENWLRDTDENGIVHPSWKQNTTHTGRMACASPNMQQLPNEDGYRSLVKPRPGNVFIVADYSQIELRIAAKIARENKLIEAYERDDDVHTLTAARITGKEDVTKEDRRLAKAVNFGLLYGMGARKLQSYAKAKYDLELSESEARKYRTRWLATYPFIRSWHRREGSTLDAAKKGADLRTETLAGRVRHHVVHYSERLNTPVQGSGADGLKAAVLELSKLGYTPVLLVHDEIVLEVPNDPESILRATEHTRTTMVEAMDRMVNVGRKGPRVKIGVEVAVADRWDK